jgi:hypothetical protein
MKIYNMIKIKMATGKTIAEESFEYDGPLTLAVDGPSGSDGSGGGDTGETDNSEKSNESDNVNSEDQTNFENTYNGNYDNGNYDCGTMKTPEGKEIPCIGISKKTVETDSYEYGNNSGYDIGSRSGGDGGSGTSLNAPGRQTEFKDLFSSYLQNSSTAQFTTGLFTGGITAIAPGGFLVNPFVDSLNYPRSFKMGYGLGQATWGTLEMLGGFGGHLLGFAFDTTGFGALAGIPTHVLSNAVGIEGAADFVAGYGVFRSAVSNPKTRWQYITAYHDKRVSDLFGNQPGRIFSNRRYDALYKGKDIEYKSSNFNRGPRTQSELKSMKNQILL